MTPAEFLEKILSESLKRDLVGGVITLKRTSNDAAAHALITKVELLEGCDPLMPYFPGNCADFIKTLTFVRPPKKPILAILRPCEMRAVVELTKLSQIQNENIIYLVHDCYGTIPRKEIRGNEIPDTEKFISEARKDGSMLRPLCRSCDYPRANTADIGWLVFEDGEPLIAYTEKGKAFLNEIGVEFVESAPDKGYKEILSKRIEEKEKLYAELEKSVKGIENLAKNFANCINCHNCMSNCPICFCRECFFESEAMEFEGDVFVELASRKGGLRAPTDVMLFHLGRMSHMSTSCVACGACEEACPEDINIGQIFKWVGENTQSIFEYKAGRSWDEEIPLKEFREEELEPR